jgi:hypothetical protein
MAPEKPDDDDTIAADPDEEETPLGPDDLDDSDGPDVGENTDED